MNKKLIDELSSLITAMYRDLDSFDNLFKVHDKLHSESRFSKAFLISSRSVLENALNLLMKEEVSDLERETVVDALNRLCVLLLEKEYEIR